LYSPFRQKDDQVICLNKPTQKGDCDLPKPNYKSKKRQKELARQEKKELKKKRKMDQKADGSEIIPDQTEKINEPPETE
jgi:hypothetical protein